jgi:2-keto-4-pentenoate hydratase/2-oxohepta-3-ene-1,7-dioic acid hydratase in catechol pathway
MRLVTYRRDGAVRHGRLLPDALGTGEIRSEERSDEAGSSRPPGAPASEASAASRAPQHIAELGDGDLGALLAAVFPLTDGTLPRPAGRYPLAGVELLAPLPRPGKLLAAAANYQDHVTETGGEPLDKTRITPRLFLKPSTSIVGPDATVELPDVSGEVDWEAELSVVIGARARHVRPADALGVVAGYMTSNDVSARSLDFGYPRDSEDKAVWFFDWLAGKWCDGFAPTGPWLVTADEAGDPQALPVELDVNGKVRQQGSTKDMIFSVAELVAHASRLMTLEPGDVIMTGTPSGVGAATGEYLRPGDVMTVTIGGLGTLRTTVA